MTALLDDTVAVLTQGYPYFAARRRLLGSDVVPARLLGQRAVCLVGPEAARFFYDREVFTRVGAIPGAVQSTLLGRGAIHTTDDDQHRRRKALFTSVLDAHGGRALVDCTGAAWRSRADRWTPGRPFSLFDAAAEALLAGASTWAGIDVPRREARRRTQDMVAMVDGFGSAGPRHVRARLARRRSERWLSDLARGVRTGAVVPRPGSPLAAVCAYVGPDGALSERLCAVELLNLVRPTVAISWFVAFAGHAFERWPEHRERVAADPAYRLAFVHELRRFYPFAPVVGARARHDTSWQGTSIAAGTLVLLDLFGQDHDGRLWSDPYAFLPQRFVGRAIDAFTLVPQGGGDVSGHRCPGEDPTIGILDAYVADLATRHYDVPAQDLRISLRRIPARPAAGLVITPVAA